MTFAILSANGEAYAITESRDETLELLVRGREYLAEAASCGHPSAAGWVDQRLPLTVHVVTRAQADELLEDGTPVLQREP